jgi:hypothetical protein
MKTELLRYVKCPDCKTATSTIEGTTLKMEVPIHCPLHAAAPELLAALSDMVDYCNDDNPEDFSVRLKRARAAIAKAEKR